jgi:hypothetical protein
MLGHGRPGRSGRRPVDSIDDMGLLRHGAMPGFLLARRLDVIEPSG